MNLPIEPVQVSPQIKNIANEELAAMLVDAVEPVDQKFVDGYNVNAHKNGYRLYTRYYLTFKLLIFATCGAC